MKQFLNQKKTILRFEQPVNKNPRNVKIKKVFIAGFMVSLKDDKR